jgi:succinate dehydrogenase/fumarate reductase flavoprotein subunit
VGQSWNGENAEGLNQAIVEIAALREEFYKDVKVPGTDKGFNQELEKAAVLLISLNGRVIC